MYKRWFSTLGWIALLTPVYIGAGKFGLSRHLTLLNGSASPIWPPTGLALAAMLAAGIPHLAGGAHRRVLRELGQEQSDWPVNRDRAGNAGEAVLGTALARRFARGRRGVRPGAGHFQIFSSLPPSPVRAERDGWG